MPNAGKSQLLNTITSTTISAVSRKRHTTRHNNILGTYTTKDQNTQLVFIDTPGFLHYNSKKDEILYRELVRDSITAMDSVDYTLLVIDSSKKQYNDKTKEELCIAVKLWCDFRTECEKIFRIIGNWNTMLITDMENLFAHYDNFNDDIKDYTVPQNY